MLFNRKNKNQQPEVRRPELRPSGRQNVFSYYASRSAPEAMVGRGEQRSVPAHPLLRKLRNAPTVLSIIVMAFAVLYTFTLGTRPRVVLVDGTDTTLAREVSEYHDAAAKVAGSSLFNRTKLTVDTAGIETKMRQQFPEIQTVEVTVPLLGHKPTMQLSTIKPVFTLISDTGEYYIASDGRATSQASAYAAKPQNTVKLYDQSGLPLKPGEQILTRDTVNFINGVTLQMQAKGVRISSLTLPPRPFEMHLRIEGAGYYVRFNTLGDARLQSGTYLAIKDSLEAQKQKPTEYIDVRVEDRAFYK